MVGDTDHSNATSSREAPWRVYRLWSWPRGPLRAAGERFPARLFLRSPANVGLNLKTLCQICASPSAERVFVLSCGHESTEPTIPRVSCGFEYGFVGGDVACAGGLA
jgi:hypothetical protein